jgi:hypothetical protein
MSLILQEPILIQHESIKIVCKYCGVEDFASIMTGKGPHAYEATCAHCCKHHKWMSRYDVEVFTKEQLETKLDELKEQYNSSDNYGEKIRLDIDIAKINAKLAGNK